MLVIEMVALQQVGILKMQLTVTKDKHVDISVCQLGKV